MLVSCICVCHNKPRLVDEAIQSILDQSYPHWEVLIVDSGVLYDAGYYDKFAWRDDKRVKLIRSDETETLRRTKAMAPWCFNECFRKGLVTGELVMYLCDDDILYPNAFETFVSYSRRNPHAQAMYASQDIAVIGSNGLRSIVGERRATEPRGRSCGGRPLDGEVDYLQFCHKLEVLRLLQDNEYWPESTDSESHADGIFMERIGERVPIHPLDVKVSQNRRTPQSIYNPAGPLGRAVRADVADWRTEALNWEQQHRLNQSYLQSLCQSPLWKLLKPVRALRRFLRPRGFNASHLLPWNQLEPDDNAAPGAWIATGSRPYFIVPCELPAGWLRIRVLLTSDVEGRFEILATGGSGISDVEPLMQADVRGTLDRTEYVYLSRPMMGMHISPLCAAGRFQLQELEVIPTSRRTPRTTEVRRMERSSQRKQGPALACAADSQSTEYPDLNLRHEATKDWSVVIPTINDVQRVVKCIRTCRDHLERGLTVEFLVVDDGTRDPDTLHKLARAADDFEFRLLLNHQNLGFSATVNHGMRHARGRYIALCNNDIVFVQPCLEAFVREFEADPEVGIVGAKLLYPKGTLQHAGMDKVPGQLRWMHSFQDFPADHPAALVSRDVWSVTGALMALRRETVQRLGGFSNAYATGYEDIDYCMHAWSNGIRSRFCAEAVAIHEESGTRGRMRGRKNKPLFWSEREEAGRRYFERKWSTLREVESFEHFIINAGRRTDHLCQPHMNT